MIDPLSLAAIAGFWIGGAFLATSALFSRKPKDLAKEFQKEVLNRKNFHGPHAGWWIAYEEEHKRKMRRRNWTTNNWPDDILN